MSRGRIYILRSPYHQDALIKIGRTSQVSEHRAKQLSSATGVPAQFEVLYEEDVHDAPLAERLVHDQLRYSRVNQRREFFQLPLKSAIRAVFEVAIKLEQIERGAAEPRLLIGVDASPNDKVIEKLMKTLKPCRGGATRVFLRYSHGDARALLELGDEWRIRVGQGLLAKIRKVGPKVSAAWHIGPANEKHEEVPF